MALTDVKAILYKVMNDEFAKRNLDIKVTRAYPKVVEQVQQKPVISIARVSGAEEIMMVADLISNAVLNDSYSETLGYLNQEIYELSIWTTISEMRDDLMILLRQILFENRLLFNSYGFQKMVLVGCTDEELDVSKIPLTIYRGVLRFLIMSKVRVVNLDQLVEQILPNLLLYSQTTEPE